MNLNIPFKSKEKCLMMNDSDRNQLYQACQNLDGSENLFEKVLENIYSNSGNSCHLTIYHVEFVALYFL